MKRKTQELHAGQEQLAKWQAATDAALADDTGSYNRVQEEFQAAALEAMPRLLDLQAHQARSLRVYEEWIKRLKINLACPLTKMEEREYEIYFDMLASALTYIDQDPPTDTPLGEVHPT